ncbi:unnamed protein product [Cladocopium goreaui]|uniref:Copia protein n=1 Tax=Cladocopium goreaui TaxID=2562237 RepID=A0A9P1D6S3_9DINO|nr:unnamed protein product [Cladocopium goreaui]
MDDLREKLRIAEERAQQNYDEMKEYQSWLQQVEEGQETLQGSNEPEYDPVPDNPPGLWGRKDGKDASLANSDIGQDGKDWVTRISRKEHEKVVVKPWPKCQDLDVWRSNVVQAVCVASGDPDTAAWRRSQTPGGKKDHNCYGWLKRDCKKGDKCTFKHDPNMKGKKAAPSAKTSDAKATPALVREYDDDFIVSAMPSEKKVKMDVKFMEHVDTFEYVKHDFSTHDIMTDQHWVLQAKLGMTRARAIGILMDDLNEFSDIDEVHIALGPKSDIKLKINSNEYLEDNPRAEMCYEEVIPHVPGEYGQAELVMKVLGLMGNSTASRTIFLDGESGDEMSESDDGVGTYVDGPTSLRRKTEKKRRSKRKTEFDRMMNEMNIKLDKEKSDKVEVVGEPPMPPTDGEPPLGPYDGPEHHSMGKPGDGIIYLSDIGEHVKLDKRGRPYRVGPDGRKEVRGSPRPKSSYSPEEWRALSAKERDVIIRRGKLEAEAEKLKEIKLKKEKEKKAKVEAAENKKKPDASSHKDPPKGESRKKKKKSNKDSKGSSGKDGGKDAAAGVGILQGEWEVEPCQGSWQSGRRVSDL